MKLEMTKAEQKMFVRGVVAGTIQVVAIGLMIALFIRMNPESFAWLF